MLMSLELPALSAVVARLAEPEINLAAYGGVVFPLALVIESPIIMLLAASTALSQDMESYRKLYKFMTIVSASLTLLHILVAFTPLYYFVVGDILGAPQEIIQLARYGLMIMTPWTWSIAYRRFNQGVLIRFGRSRKVGVGTVVRLTTNLAVLAIGYQLGTMPGIIVASSAVAAGVFFEAVYAGIAVRPILRYELKSAPPAKTPLTLKSFLAFYIPLVFTSLLTLLVNPITSAAVSRMPYALESLAAWPAVAGYLFMFRSLGIAYNEVVVALLDEPNSTPPLRKFAIMIIFLSTVGFLLLVATPLSRFLFSTISALPENLVSLARVGIWIALPLPALSVLQSWYQGAILFGRKTRAITEAVVIYLLSSGLLLGAGVILGTVKGFYVGITAMTSSTILQTLWLWQRSRPVMGAVRQRDEMSSAL